MSVTIARATALEILDKVDSQGAFVNKLLNDIARESKIDPRDQALIHHIVKGTLQNRSAIDSLLEPLVKGGFSTLKPTIQNILRLTTYQIKYLDRIPTEAAVYEAVELAKINGHPGVARLVNAVLRNMLRQSTSLEVKDQNLATKYSHPEWLANRFIQQLGENEAEALMAYNNTRWPVQLRVNSLVITPDELFKKISAEGVVLQPSCFDSLSFTVDSLPKKKKLHELEAYLAGAFQIQDESASLVSLLLNPEPGNFIIDLCAAPGGKCVNIAGLIKNAGKILAVDPSDKRLAIVKENCARQSVTCVTLQCADGTNLQTEQLADRILIDAPCSGFGVLGRRSDARWNKEPDEPQRLHELQLQLLDHAAVLVKIGGLIVYSTCTIDTLENEGTVEKFLANHTNFILKHPATNFPQALITKEGYYKTLPHKHHIGGAFGAILERVS